MKFSIEKLKSMQKETAKRFQAEDNLDIKEIKKIAGFDVTYNKDTAVCVGVVLDIKTLEILETKQITTKVTMNYIPGFLAFREGPPILQVYYDFENEPDLLFISGHGIAHPMNCGLATYIGVELAKPSIGVAKSLIQGEIKDQNIILNNKIVGKEIKTREYARPIFISQGNMVSLKFAEKLVKKLIIPPHKLPEPLHIAHKLAGRLLKEIRQKK